METLSFPQLNEYLLALPKDKKVAAFYINKERTSQTEWMAPLAGKIKEKGWIAIAITSNAPKSLVEFGANAVLAVINKEDMSRLERINVLLLLDEDCDFSFPNNSKVLVSPHCLFTTGSKYSLPAFLPMYTRADGILTPVKLNPENRKAIHDLWNGFIHPSYLERKKEYFHIISAGYPRLNVLSQRLGRSALPRDALVYAPTMMTYANHIGGNRIREHGEKLIRCLLRAFPEKKIIFRPQRNDLNSPVIQQIQKNLAGHPRFIFDRSHSRYFSFARAEVLITDFSTITTTFALATGRPSICFWPWHTEKLDIKPSDYRHFVFSLRELVNVSKYCIDHNEEEKSDIEKKLSGIFMPFENALDDIAAAFDDFLNDRTRPEWLTLKRSDSMKTKSDVEIVKTIIEQNGETFGIIRWALLYSNPASPLFLAFALHTSAKYQPHETEPLYFQLACEWFGENIPLSKFCEFPGSKIRQLYEVALLEKIKNNDEDGKKLIESLLTKYNNDFPEA